MSPGPSTSTSYPRAGVLGYLGTISLYVESRGKWKQENLILPRAKILNPNTFVLNLLSGKALQNTLLFQTVVMGLLPRARGQAPRRNDDTSTSSEKPSISKTLPGTCSILGMCLSLAPTPQPPAARSGESTPVADTPELSAGT